MPDEGSPGGLVLVVEDDADAQQVAESMLAMLGYRTRLASNGRRALQLLGEFRPDIILLDLHMPELDGLAFLDTARRELPHFDSLRIIATSGVYQNQTSISRPLERRGVRHFVGKPFSLQRLEAALNKALADEGNDDDLIELPPVEEPPPTAPASRQALVRAPSSGPTEELSSPRGGRRRQVVTAEHARLVVPRSSGQVSRPGVTRPSSTIGRDQDLRASTSTSRPPSRSAPSTPGQPRQTGRQGGLARPAEERASGAVHRSVDSAAGKAVRARRPRAARPLRARWGRAQTARDRFRSAGRSRPTPNSSRARGVGRRHAPRSRTRPAPGAPPPPRTAHRPDLPKSTGMTRPPPKRRTWPKPRGSR